MKINQYKQVQVDAKTLSIYMKVCDSFSATLIDADGQTIAEQDRDYVPSFMPGEHYGDYLILEIDIDTGQIKNWKRPTEEQLSEWVEKLTGGRE